MPKREKNKRFICKICGKLLTASNTYPSTFKRREYKCKNCRNNVNKQHHKQYSIRIKKLVVEAYGGKCICCGETIQEFLSIDHINNNGKQDRLKYGSGTSFYVRLKHKNFPKKEYQLLCMNCNFAKGKFGGCPHQKETK